MKEREVKREKMIKQTWKEVNKLEHPYSLYGKYLYFYFHFSESLKLFQSNIRKKPREKKGSRELERQLGALDSQ